ncbi:hypothetical protein [Chitinibacter sp. S2-10]|uniref:hypothetical protein n=1 Tax=Chitinibacter sp. S2-10 TaxID=3373597 RepID=UPI003977B8CA
MTEKNKKTHSFILNRAGKIFITIGVLNICYSIYCNNLHNSILLILFFTITNIVPGLFILRGSLLAAAITRWLAAFSLSIFAPLIFMIYIISQPIGLTLTQIKLFPVSMATLFITIIIIFGFLYWTIKELGHQEIKTQITNKKKTRNIFTPIILGLTFTVISNIMWTFNQFHKKPFETKAIEMSKQELGTTYDFHVDKINIEKNGIKQTITGTVIAWNNKEIKSIKVRWND